MKSVEIKSIEEQLVDFLGEAQKSTSISLRRWLHGMNISIYVRKEAKEGKLALTIANAQFNDLSGDIEQDQVYRKYINLIHQLNPFDLTVMETVGKDLGQWLWDNDWRKLEQPGCFAKTRNHGPMPMDWFYEQYG